MPVSNPDHLPALVHLVSGLQPRRLLDVGIGMGSFGLLARQSLDICYGRLSPSNWQVTIDGAEIFEGYRNPVWDFAYSTVHMGDIRQLLPTLPRYDVVICCDVLEHFDPAEARTLIGALLDHSATLIATSPNHFIPQDAWGGNESERHLSVIGREDFPGLAVHHRGAGTDLFAASNDPERRATLRAIAAASPRSLPPPSNTLLRRAWRRLRRQFQ
jgi:hypothetical protein